MFIDLVTGIAYGTKRGAFEIELEYPFWEFIMDVDPFRGEKSVCGMWLSYLGTGNWNHFVFNRHGSLENRVDTDSFWNKEYEESDAIMAPDNKYGHSYSFNLVAHDLAYAASCLSAYTKQEMPVAWAARLYEYIGRQRHPNTRMLASTG